MKEKLPTGGILTPAYGRDYKSRKAIVEALNKPLDFTWNKQLDEGYCSVTDLPDGHIEVRYKQNRNLCVITITNGVAL